MDSEDSRDASSGNDSDQEANIKSPSSRSKSRSSSSDRDAPGSPRSRSQSVNSNHESAAGSHRSMSSRRRSSKSRSSSPENGPESPPASPPERGRPRTPKSPDSASMQSGRRSASPPSRHASPRSVDNRPASPSNSSGSRSHSSSSSRSHSPRSERAYSKSKQTNGFQNSLSAPQSPDDAEDKRSSRSKSRSADRLSAAGSNKSMSSRDSRQARKMADLDDGITSDSSISSDTSFRRKNKSVAKNPDTQPEEISDGDMESDNDKKSNASSSKSSKKKEVLPNINMNHEDLSDVSDLDESIGGHTDEEETLEKQASKLRQQIEEIHNPEFDQNKINEKTNRAEEGEEQLDFEAEDGECGEIEPPKEKDKEEKMDARVQEITELEEGEQDDQERERVKQPKEELEEGEVTDEDDVRPEETEPRPVCRFFSRGQCTWGASCRFLHPGVTDKGNYTMFEMIRPVIPGEYGRDDRLYGSRLEPPPVESAWERGLRTAKEMLRKSLKRKEQDTDFEEKKMNLTLAQEEFDKENGYYLRPASPESRYVSMRHPVPPVDYPPPMRPPPPEDYYSRRQVLYEPEYAAAPRERVRPYRELPPHRMPDYYNTKYEEEAPKTKRPKREVIVQRVEAERQGRGDEWSDPWMRSKSPSARKGRKRSYSSGSSYSSSSSSRSSTGSSRSSYRSRSQSPKKSRRSPRSHRSRISPSVIVSERKAAIERAALMNPPAPKKKAPSPGMMRAGAQNPPAPSKVDQYGRTRSKLAVAEALARVKARQRSSRSSSGSSGSSSSDSDSSDSSSSTSRDENSPPRRSSGVQDLAMAALKAKAIDALKGNGAEKRQIKLNLKTPVGVRKADMGDAAQGSKKRAGSPSSLDPKSAANKKATSRREELLKQLKAVEDAIAKKRNKVN